MIAGALNRVVTCEHVKPWMQDREIRVVQDVLRRVGPMRCLEWGAGQSTRYFSKCLRSGGRWLTLEHDAEWFQAVNQQLAHRPCYSLHRDHERHEFHVRHRGLSRYVIEPVSYAVDRVFGGPRVDLVHIPPNQFPWSDPDGDGTYADLRDYVEYPTRSGPFEFILIDGRARLDCLVKAHSLLTNDGVVILHDAGRSYYHAAFSQYESQLLLRDERDDEAGIWIGSRRASAEWLDALAEIRRSWEHAEA